MRSRLVEKVKGFLEKESYDLFEYPRGCFDIAAKREKILLVKVLTNVDSFQEKQARDLKVLAKSLSASPVIVGERTRKENLEEGVIYERFKVPVLNFETFKSTVKGDYPYKVRSRGGVFGKLGGKKLKKLREINDMTQSELAEKLGVSQKSISEHERGGEKTSYPVVKLVENLFGGEVKERVNPFEVDFDEIKGRCAGRGLKGIGEYMEEVGFEIRYTSRAPPQLIAEEKMTLLSRMGNKKRGNEERSLKNFSEITGSPAFIMLGGSYDSDELPVLSKEEVVEVKDSEELVKIVKERGESL